MAKTLVIKLAETVDNPNLPKLTELKISIYPLSSLLTNRSPSATTQNLDITSSEALPMTLTGEGHFTDSTLAQDLGKTFTKPAGFSTVYISDGRTELSILNKYAITRICTYTGNSNYHGHFQLKTSDIAKLVNLTDLTLQGFGLKGSLSDIGKMTQLTHLYLSQYTDGANNISGSLADIAGLTKLKNLDLWANYLITGDISSLLGMTNLVKADLSYCGRITGDTSSIASLHPNNGGKLATLGKTNTGITGNWPPSA